MTNAASFARACAVVALASAIAGTFGCKETKAPPVGPNRGTVDTAEQVGFGVRTVLTGNGVQRGELVADTMFIYNDQTKFDFRNARVKFNTETGAPNGTMRADRGLYDLRTQVLEGFGNVVVTSVDGKRLKSPHLKFNQLANEVSSDTTFEMVAGARTQSGVGFRTDPNLNRFSCLRACRTSGTISIPSQ
jgi:LPS export ABC transporter protein LptC